MQTDAIDAKARLAEQIAAATRILVMEEILDYSGHIACRLPGTDRFLVQNATDARSELSPGGIMEITMDGDVVAGRGKPPLELALHLEILRARPDVTAVLHCHMELAITFTLMKGVELRTLRPRAVRWADGIPTHPDPSLIRRPEQGRALAGTLGSRNAALIRAHGLVLTAESVPALLVDAVHFKANARQFMLVLQAGREPLPLTPEEIAMIDSPREFHVAKLWNYYIRKGKAAGKVPDGWSSELD